MQKEAHAIPSDTHWKRNLYAVFASQFIVLLGFNFVTPFMPLLVKSLGNFTDQQAALLGGLASGAPGIAMFFTAPLWGILADRWGRKPMVLRAQFGSSLIMVLIGFATSVPCIIALRFIQGTFSGTVSAAAALVAGSTPRNRLPFAMGLLMLASFSAQSAGPIFGGLMSDTFGYHTTFLASAALMLIGAFVILFLVQENFKRRGKTQATTLADVWRLATSKQQLPLLAALFAVNAGPQIVLPVIPLLCGKLETGGRPATTAGLAFCLMGVTAALSSLAAGRMGERLNLKKLLVISCMCTGLLYLPPIWAATVTQLIIFIAITGLSNGGSLTSSNALVGLSASSTQQGVAYGIAQSANSLGYGLGPLIGGGLGNMLGLRPVFAIASGLYIIVGLLSSKFLKIQEKAQPQPVNLPTR